MLVMTFVKLLWQQHMKLPTHFSGLRDTPELHIHWLLKEQCDENQNLEVV